MNLLVNYFSKQDQTGHLSEADFKAFFARYGKVTEISLNHESQSHWSGFVRMEEGPAAMRVIQRYLNGCFWHGGCISAYVPLFFQEHAEDEYPRKYM